STECDAARDTRLAGFTETSPGRRVVRPGAAEHRRHDLHLGKLPGLARERVAVEHDEVGEVAGDELAAAPFVSAEPGRRDRRRVQGLLDAQRLLRVPGLALVE